MSLSAIDRLDDALDATKALLLPLDADTWIRLAVMAFFIGGLGGGLTTNFDASGASPSGGQLPEQAVEGLVGSSFLPVLAVVAVVAAVVGLLFLYVGSVMEFVLVGALTTREVSVRDRFRARRWQGTRLFAFRLGLLLFVGLLVAGAVGLSLMLLGGPGVVLLGLVLAAPVLLVAVTVVAVVHGFTTVFVVPIMYAERCGVLDGWRRLWPSIRGEPTEFGAYLVLSVVLGAVGGMVVSTVVGLLGLVLFLPLGVVGVAALSSGGSLLFLLLPVLLVAALALAAVGAVVRVPVLAYLRYYALLVLGDLTAYDLLAGRISASDPSPTSEGRDDENGADEPV